MSSWDRPHPEVRPEGREPLPDKAGAFIDYSKAFDSVDHNKLWKILKEVGIPDHLTCLWETCMQVRKQHLELDMEKENGS